MEKRRVVELAGEIAEQARRVSEATLNGKSAVPRQEIYELRDLVRKLEAEAEIGTADDLGEAG